MISGPSGTLMPASSRVGAAPRLVGAFADTTAACLSLTISSAIGALLCFARVLNDPLLIARQPRQSALPAVSCAFIGDVAYVVQIEALRSAALIVDRVVARKICGE